MHGRSRIVQVHPTLRCNLRCRHCYSLSGPERAESLPLEVLLPALDAARREGYDVLSVSGGEPLLLRELPRLVEHAKALGNTTTVTTNGTVVTERRLAALAPHLDLLAISLDGVPEAHDRMRGAGAFERLRRRLPAVRASGIAFGFIFTLTQHNLDELTWIADFCREQGARLLQIHPLESVGRAREELPQAVPDAREAAFAFLRTLELQANGGDALQVQLDLVDQRYIAERPERVFAGEAAAPGDSSLSDLVTPLVLETDGTVSPLEYGFRRDMALGNLHDAPLEELAERWREDGWRRFNAHCRSALGSLAAPRELPLVNWFDVVGGREPTAAA